MIISDSPESWVQLWGAVEDEMQESSEKGLAIIFSVHEVETVCSVKMMQVALKAKGIQFSQHPVEDEAQLKSTLEQLLTDSTEFRTVVLLNCGASTFVKDMAPSNSKGVRFLIVDSHRPIHHRYNDEHNMDALLVLSDDDPHSKNDVPPVCELDNVRPVGREQLQKDADLEAQLEVEAEGVVDSPAKRQRLEQGAGRQSFFRDALRMLHEREKLLAKYYNMASSYGKPTPLVLLPFAQLLTAKTDNGLLWAAAVEALLETIKNAYAAAAAKTLMPPPPAAAAAGPAGAAAAFEAALSMASDARHGTQTSQQQQQQQLQRRQYLAAERAVLGYHAERMRVGDSRLLPVLQGMTRMFLRTLTGGAGGQQQQQQQVQQYLDAYTEAKGLCAACDSALEALDSMCSIALGPLALGRGA